MDAQFSQSLAFAQVKYEIYIYQHLCSMLRVAFVITLYGWLNRHISF